MELLVLITKKTSSKRFSFLAKCCHGDILPIFFLFNTVYKRKHCQQLFIWWQWNCRLRITLIAWEKEFFELYHKFDGSIFHSEKSYLYQKVFTQSSMWMVHRKYPFFLPFGFLYLKVVAYFGAAYGFGLFHLFSVAPIVISCQTCSYNRLCTELFKWGLWGWRRARTGTGSLSKAVQYWIIPYCSWTPKGKSVIHFVSVR